ncbi:hypothetical protein K438DRAFT_1775531 [Mycena galopus ATCC 62051]|nr:hypothetical protein K438DRAFT_1775531 [Mycena galopus ATCC 62051]
MPPAEFRDIDILAKVIKALSSIPNFQKRVGMWRDKKGNCGKIQSEDARCKGSKQYKGKMIRGRNERRTSRRDPSFWTKIPFFRAFKSRVWVPIGLSTQFVSGTTVEQASSIVSYYGQATFNNLSSRGNTVACKEQDIRREAFNNRETVWSSWVGTV